MRLRRLLGGVLGRGGLLVAGGLCRVLCRALQRLRTVDCGLPGLLRGGWSADSRNGAASPRTSSMAHIHPPRFKPSLSALAQPAAGAPKFANRVRLHPLFFYIFC